MRTSNNRSKLLVAATLLAVALGAVAPSCGYAQDQQSPADLLTAERLIGTAVSLANQDYPEIENAIQRFRNGDVVNAYKFLEMASQKYPKLPPVDVTMAKMQLIARNRQAAHQLLEKAIAEHPDDPEAYLLLADQAFAGNRITEAHALFLMAKPVVDQFSGNDKRNQNFQVRVVAGQAAVFERRGQWERALELLRQWVELDPDSANARNRLGVSLFHMNQAKEAFQQFTEARDIDPKLNHPYISLGRLLMQKDELGKARKAYELGYAEDGDNEQTAQAYAEWLISQDDLEKAQEVAQKLKEESPQSKTALVLLGVIAKLRGDLDGVQSAMNELLKIDGDNATAINMLALTLIESDSPADRDRALKFAEKNAQKYSNAAQANITLAWVLHKLGRDGEAKAQIEIGARAGRVTADSAYLVAQIVHEQGDDAQAKAMLEQLMQRAGEDTFLYRKEAEQLLNKLSESG